MSFAQLVEQACFLLRIAGVKIAVRATIPDLQAFSLFPSRNWMPIEVRGTSWFMMTMRSQSESPPDPHNCVRRNCGLGHYIGVNDKHISGHDLERYYLGMVTEETELAELEEHLLCCPPCVDRAEETQDYVDLIRETLIRAGFDLDLTFGGYIERYAGGGIVAGQGTAADVAADHEG